MIYYCGLRFILFLYLSLAVTLSVHAQTLRGIVIDGETLKPLYPATVVNISTEQFAITDSFGNFNIDAKAGDRLSITFSGCRTIQRIADPLTKMLVELLPISVKLAEFTLKDYTAFQKDSIEMTTLYSKELNKKPVKVGFSNANGGGFTGLIGAPVQRMSRSYKQNKKFKENFKKDLEQKYIDTKYTAALVTTLTGFAGDSLAIFMNSYKMDYDFARHATDLELKSWIRGNYKEYNAAIIRQNSSAK